MVPGIDPKIDYAFKHLFGHEHEIALLFGLLDAVLCPPPEHRLVELNLLNPFNEKDTLDDKLSILDIKARDQSGRQYNIEMQLLAHGAFRQRALYYWARFYQSQLQEGEDYQSLRQTISICFVNTPLFPEVADHHLVFDLREQRHDVVFNDHLALHILELWKFKKSAAELLSPLDRWLYFLRHGERLDADTLPSSLDNPEIRQALGVLQNMSTTAAERERYEARKKYQHDMATWQVEIEQARAEAENARAKLINHGLFSRIHLCQRLLHRAETTEDQLRQLPPEGLEALAVSLEAELTSSFHKEN